MSGRSVRSTTTHDDDAKENDANDAMPRGRGRANDDAMYNLCFVKQENFRTREKRFLSRAMGGERRGRRRRGSEGNTVGVVDD